MYIIMWLYLNRKRSEFPCVPNNTSYTSFVSYFLLTSNFVENSLFSSLFLSLSKFCFIWCWNYDASKCLVHFLFYHVASHTTIFKSTCISLQRLSPMFDFLYSSVLWHYSSTMPLKILFLTCGSSPMCHMCGYLVILCILMYVDNGSSW